MTMERCSPREALGVTVIATEQYPKGLGKTLPTLASNKEVSKLVR